MHIVCHVYRFIISFNPLLWSIEMIDSYYLSDNDSYSIYLIRTLFHLTGNYFILVCGKYIYYPSNIQLMINLVKITRLIMIILFYLFDKN